MRFLEKATKSPSQISSGSGASLFSGAFSSQSSVPRRTASQIMQLWRQSPWVRLASEVVATRVADAQWSLIAPTRGVSRHTAIHHKQLVATAPWKDRSKLIKELIDDGAAQRITDHPFLRMVHQGVIGTPWLELPGYEVTLLGQMTRDIAGEEIEILARDNTGIPVSWYPVPPHWARPPNRDRKGFEISVNGRSFNIPAEDVVWHRIPDISNPFSRGAGIAQSLDHEIEIDEQASAYLVSILRNRARPDLVIMGPGIGPREKQEMETAWRSQLGGKARQGLVHFLGIPASVSAKEVTIKDLNTTAADLEMSKMRDHERDIILQVWRVPPDAIGAAQNSNRSTAFQAERSLRENAVVPSLERRCRFLQSRFFEQRGERPPEYAEDRLQLVYEVPRLIDTDQQLQAVKASPWTLDDNEMRQVQGFPPTEEGQGVRWVPRRLRQERLGEPVEPNDPLGRGIEENGDIKLT